jgi:uncharacterized membrane protein
VGRLDRHAAREDRAVNAPQVGPTGLERSLELAAMPPTWVVVLLVAPAVLGVCWLGYRGSGLGPLWRLGLATLRALALGLLCLILFRPVMVERFDHRLPPQVLVLVDDSASMRRKDAYASDASSDAAAKILGAWAAPLPLHEATRSALARAGLERELLPLLEQRGYEARLFAFSAGLRPLSKGLELAASGGTTQIGASLERALEQALGCHVTDVVIVSDGRQTAGPPAALASRAARGAGVDVHTVVVGDTRQEKNAWLELVEAPESALEGDEIAVSVRAAGVGLAAGEKVSVLLEERLADDEARGPILDTEERTLDEGGLRLTLEAGTEPGDPQGRERRFLIKIPPLEGETLRDDNQIEVSVRIVPEKVRVLYVEGYPRWEYRFLKELLKRSDENIRVQMMLLSATSDFPQESTRGEPSLLEVPCTREALLAQYDVVLLGDVSPWQVSPDPARAQQFLEALVQFVESGGGLAFLAGEYDNPRAYVSTPLEALVPVVLDSAELGSARVDTSRSFRPRLEDPGNAHEIVRLRPDPQENRSLWEEEGGLFPMYWYQPVTRVKPASQVLLRHPSEGGRAGNFPLLVTGYYPSGRTLFLAFDETWRWRFHYGDVYHERFWRSAVRWLALGRLKSGDRRFKLEVAKSEIELGASQLVEARVLDEDFRPDSESSRTVFWSSTQGKPQELELSSAPGRPGVYRGSLAPTGTGTVRLWLENAGERLASAEFDVVLPSQEQADPSPDAALMSELALLGRGKAVELARLSELAREFPGGEERREPLHSRSRDIWDSWHGLVLALCLLSAEWALRKRAELV